jgi:hypothetical protein
MDSPSQALAFAKAGERRLCSATLFWQGFAKPTGTGRVTDIFREIDEDLRRDNFAKIWKRYGNYVIGVALAVVVGTAGFVVWRDYEEGLRHEQSIAFASALAAADNTGPEAGLEALQTLAAEGERPYSILARFESAGLLVKQGDTAGALAQYDALSKDSDIGDPLRGAATILYALHALDSEDPAALVARLEPLTAADSPWRYSALELTGLAARRSGDTARAREIFATLADDLDAPQGVRGRAVEILATLQG